MAGVNMGMMWCNAGWLVLGCLSCAFFTGASRAHEAGLETSIVSDLLESWGLSDGYKLAAVADGYLTEVQLDQYNTPLLILTGHKLPVRRNASAGETFLAIENVESLSAWNASFISELLAVPAINRGSHLIEAVTGRPLFPLRLSVAELEGPHAVYEVSTGRVVISYKLMEKLTEGTMPERLGKVLTSFVNALFHQISLLLGIGSAAGTPGHSLWSSLFSTAAPIAAGIALAGQIPLWFCFACPIVLGMLFPFAFNFGFGAAADLVCQHYNLPTAECNDLWYGAFAVAMVLSFASAIPIVYICRLPDCARRSMAALL